MIILHGAGAGFGLPEVSPYVTKAEVQLQMAGLAYRKERTPPNRSPKGQVPFIEDGADVVADSTFIRAYLEQKYDFDLDDGLSPVERAQSWAIERMLENHFGWTVSYTRWIIPENFANGPAHFFDDAPAAVRDDLRDEVQGRVAGTLYGIGITRHAHDEITELGDRSLLALSELLADKPYLMGERPTGVDATAFAMLAAVMTPFFDSPLRQCAMSYRNLTAYVDRMMAQHYPSFAWTASCASHVEEVD